MAAIARALFIFLIFTTRATRILRRTSCRRSTTLRPILSVSPAISSKSAPLSAEALDFVRQIKAPIYGVPGNHEYSAHAPFAEYEKAFAATGGGWLPARNVTLPEHDLQLVGMGITGLDMHSGTNASRRILLMHYPAVADQMGKQRFDLILAGHSHGGQVRLPFWGPIVLPPGVGSYDLGFYETPAGPLYVNGGVGTYIVPWRFNCPPELTLITI